MLLLQQAWLRGERVGKGEVAEVSYVQPHTRRPLSRKAGCHKCYRRRGAVT